ncbi:MAG: B12-binding domain/radical SAM domain protein [Desulfuromonadales bacterium GWD2_61_12]|nr:MAG: B12-binding domain/radical SAM domain protein [Desulfuromonadales bacterium GWC2_61_20]OGR32431.1 MAG: B12-binding domain/radical SAM domain protein [Desulfuromonadales bacterium GWD2_61_12]HAD04099.1 TIGR04190 family B12-binding domain/radical SAM domain protein [Desulfuromonas sp.]HBT83944.1 TIGR04190 family B12-binding domain/radical SAM domain protein [Desulfuromonas sp.]
MARTDLVLLHPPSIFDFREAPVFSGPVSDVVPSSSIFEIYPVGFLTLAAHLEAHGVRTRIVNLALKMLRDERFDPAAFLPRLKPQAFGIDLHWLPHVDGALALAELLKSLHPTIPVILGGLSATYYHDEILRDYPAVDFVLCGDSTEEPLRLLMAAIARGDGYAEVPNLAWRGADGSIINNGINWQPDDLDFIRFDYLQSLRLALRHRDPYGYLPFRGWLRYPVSAVVTGRGCAHNCLSCGGSRAAFRTVCGREHPVFRAPERVAADIRRIADYTTAPIFVLGDLLQAGRGYGERFLDAFAGSGVTNEIAVEFFTPPPLDFLHRLGQVIPNYNVEISPESHDLKIRETFGKNYGNAELETMLHALLDNGCRRVDLFFMIGLPHQDYASVMATIDYCGTLLDTFGPGGRLLPMIAPLAPFIDPGSAIFEDPLRYGYRLFYRSLAEHRQAMRQPSWLHGLNYETTWMSRADIVRATYDAAERLLALKVRHGLLTTGQAEQLQTTIGRARTLVAAIGHSGPLDAALRQEIRELNGLAALCDKHELEWPISGWKLHPLKILRGLLAGPSKIA